MNHRVEEKKVEEDDSIIDKTLSNVNSPKGIKSPAKFGEQE